EVDQSYVTVERPEKFRLLHKILKRDDHPITIVFTNTKAAARKLAKKLYDAGIDAKEIHGDLIQKKRDRVMDQLFPDFPPVSEPVIPKNTKWNFQPKSVTKPDGSFEPTISALFGDDFYEYGAQSTAVIIGLYPAPKQRAAFRFSVTILTWL
ncbi:DEAD/DEAH box helicase, partial [candidate division KSB1 bacterium]|nr:DEAD/DEAH box helicase [candidate division KSB1 bacterium]